MAGRARALAGTVVLLCSPLTRAAAESGLSGAAPAGSSPWCPKYHLQHQPLLGDPSAPIRRVVDDTWHLYNGAYHFTSKDLFRWRTQDFGFAFGLTGSMSFTESGYLIHRPALGGISRAVPNGTGAAGLDDFSDQNCAFRDPPAVTGPGKEWHSFMDSPSRALKLSDGRYYMATAGYCCNSGVSCGANPCPQGMGVPWFVAGSPSLSSFSFAGYLHNISSSLGSFQPGLHRQVRSVGKTMVHTLFPPKMVPVPKPGFHRTVPGGSAVGLAGAACGCACPAGPLAERLRPQRAERLPGAHGPATLSWDILPPCAASETVSISLKRPRNGPDFAPWAG